MRTILISGASRGIGLNIAHKELKEGNRVPDWKYGQNCLVTLIADFILDFALYKSSFGPTLKPLLVNVLKLEEDVRFQV